MRIFGWRRDKEARAALPINPTEAQAAQPTTPTEARDSLSTTPTEARAALPITPTEGGLTDAVSHAAAGNADTLARLLLAATRSGDPDLVAQAERTLATSAPRLWPALDVSVRRYFHTSRPGITARGLSNRDLPPLELVLAACHPSGHVREPAVDRLSGLDHALAAPVLALRAADWVEQVRDRARQACDRRLADSPAAAFTALAPVAYAVRERLAGRRLADTLDALLRDGPPEVLAAALTLTDWRARRAAYLTALAAGRLTLPQLLHAARTDPDLPIRTRCAEAAIRAAREAGDRDVPRQLLTSRTAAVRAEAVHALDEATSAETALTDRSALVRATAQAVLRRAGRNPATTYRALVAAEEVPEPAAVAGLGETGDATDTTLLRPWLAHPRPRGRAEAVRALRRLGHAPADLLLGLLTDPSAVVTRQVTTALRPTADALDEHLLRGLLADRHPRHTRFAAYRLLHDHGVWTRLQVDLELFDDPLVPLRDHARADLFNWLGRDAATTYAMPPPAAKARLDELLRRTEPSMDAHRLRELRFHLGL